MESNIWINHNCFGNKFDGHIKFKIKLFVHSHQECPNIKPAASDTGNTA